jgi:hypothetical protein
MRSVKRWIHRNTFVTQTLLHARAVMNRGRKPYGDVPPVPMRIGVEPTNACNLRCTYCGNKNMQRRATYLPLPLYERLLDEMVELGIPRITLHTIGEPTLHRDIAKMVAMATERDRVVSLSTNGTLIDNALALDLVRAGPDLLNFSADAGDAETLRRTRPGLELDSLLEGLRLVKHHRDTVGMFRDSPWGRVRMPTITMTCVRTSWFTPEVERQFFATFSPYVDDFCFRAPNNHASYALEEERPHGLLPPRLREAVYRLVRKPCPYPWDALYLLSDGTMSVCAFDHDARVTVGRYGPQSLLELWNSEAMQSLRRAHMSFEFGEWPICETCTGCTLENRHEDFEVTQRVMRRNGYAPRRSGWLGVNPRNVGPRSAAEPAAAARPL